VSENTQHHPDETLGILYAGSTYVVWGFMPLYWRLLSDVAPVEITLHRILWGALFATLVSLARGHFRHIVHILRRPRTLAALATSSVLIAANWTLYIWCVATHQLVEASLGYYLTPLVSIAVGVALLGERISRLRLGAIGLAAIAVAAQAFAFGHVPWIGLCIALSFGFYGYVRKQTAVDALDGLTVETLLLFPVALSAIGYWAFQRTGGFSPSHIGRDALLMGGGPATAIPLALFSAGARRIRMTTLGFLQYLSPTITLIIATTWLGETFTKSDAITFGCVWAALILVGLEGTHSRLRRAG